MTLLDKDEAEFERIVKTIAAKIVEYIESGNKNQGLYENMELSFKSSS
jgi:hypothetical protein